MKDKIKILIVDDEEHTRMGYKEVLEMSDYEADAAGDARTGLELAGKKQYDVIITDLRMPEVDGLAFLERLRKFDEISKAIVITAFGSFKTYKKSQDLGAVTYLNKPVKAADLKGAVDEVLGDIGS
ncbi:response regulator [Limisalsivibrio acetivorans]|uniref:response regulator n=1 Tax=Limisalsivibrio acetivorans TaxID=1304888 RepID=UPI0003B729F5|nr:response regulator [Limisalsivibrio acetivorans]